MKILSIVLSAIANFYIMLGFQRILVKKFEINSTMAWIIVMFLMAISEADQFLDKL